MYPVDLRQRYTLEQAVVITVVTSGVILVVMSHKGGLPRSFHLSSPMAAMILLNLDGAEIGSSTLP